MTTFQERLPKTDFLYIPFIMAGDPTPEVTIDLALSLQEAGAHVIELGIPYSDPLADGPVIQRAAKRALKNKMTLHQAMELVPLMRKKGLKIPVLIFTYFNPVLQLGENSNSFFALARKNDIDGVLIPDLPFEESNEFREKCFQEGLEFISLVAPTSHTRIEKIVKEASGGFLYCISSLGVTGVRSTINPEIHNFLQTVKKFSRIPVAVGFGISNYEQVRTLKDDCDGVIVGSVIVNKIEELEERLLNGEEKEAALVEFKGYVESIVSPCKTT